MATTGANTHRGRVMILVSLITVGYVGLGVRLVDIQVLQHDKHAAHALDNTRRKVIHASRRGDILDIRGTVLATSRVAKTVCADPSLMGTHQQLVARAIAPFLGKDAGDLAKCPHLQARDFFVEVDHPVVGRAQYLGMAVRLPGETITGSQPAPLLGQHNAEIYGQKLGHSNEDLISLRQQGVI